jgi:hypothetical protein
MGQMGCFWVLLLGSMLSHFQEYVKNFEFLSQRHTVAITRGCKLASEEEEPDTQQQQQQQEDWELLWGYFRQHAGTDFGGLVAVAFVLSIALCEIGGDRHMAAMKVMLASPLMLISCDRFVVSCSGQFARQLVHSLCYMCTTLFSVSVFCSAFYGQKPRPVGGFLEFLLTATPVVMMVLGMVLGLQREWILNSFLVSCCLCFAGSVDTTSLGHFAMPASISDARNAVNEPWGWLLKLHVWFWLAFNFWGSTFGRVSGRAGAQTRIASEAQLQLPSLETALPLMTSSPACVCGLFVVSTCVWYADCPHDITSISTSVSLLLYFVHALGLALSVPFIVNCFSETKMY